MHGARERARVRRSGSASARAHADASRSQHACAGGLRTHRTMLKTFSCKARREIASSIPIRCPPATQSSAAESTHSHAAAFVPVSPAVLHGSCGAPLFRDVSARECERERERE